MHLTQYVSALSDNEMYFKILNVTLTIEITFNNTLVLYAVQRINFIVIKNCKKYYTINAYIYEYTFKKKITFYCSVRSIVNTVANLWVNSELIFRKDMYYNSYVFIGDVLRTLKYNM